MSLMGIHVVTADTQPGLPASRYVQVTRVAVDPRHNLDEVGFPCSSWHYTRCAIHGSASEKARAPNCHV
jgi:hypothetical protein